MRLVAGEYLHPDIRSKFNSLDGSCVKAWLESIGYEVILYRDRGRYGEAVTSCGFSVSTNGYVSKVITID